MKIPPDNPEFARFTEAMRKEGFCSMSEYENGCPILEDEVIHDNEWICPRCGLICESLTEYHKHFKRAGA